MWSTLASPVTSSIESALITIPKLALFISPAVQISFHKSVKPPKSAYVSDVCGTFDSASLFSAPIAPLDLTIFISSHCQLLAPTPVLASTSTNIPLIVAPSGIENPKLVALR